MFRVIDALPCALTTTGPHNMFLNDNNTRWLPSIGQSPLVNKSKWSNATLRSARAHTHTKSIILATPAKVQVDSQAVGASLIFRSLVLFLQADVCFRSRIFCARTANTVDIVCVCARAERVAFDLRPWHLLDAHFLLFFLLFIV
jgi:hypothetical protein